MEGRSFLELPKEVHLHMFSFLHKQDVARMGRVCKAFQNTTKDPLSPFARLSYEPLDYSKSIGIRKPTYYGLFEKYVFHLTPLSKTRIACSVISDSDLGEVETIGVFSIDFQGNLHEATFRTANYFAIAGIDDCLIAGKSVDRKLAIEVWNVSDDLQKSMQIKEIMTDFHSGEWSIFGLSKNLFILHGSPGIFIYDLTQPEKQEIIHAHYDPQFWIKHTLEKQFARLTDTQFIFDRNQTHMLRAIEVYDVTQPQGQQIIRQLVIDTNSKYLTVLSNGCIAYLSDHNWNAGTSSFEKSDVCVTILDLSRPSGQERVGAIKILNQEVMLKEDPSKTVTRLLALPNDCLAIGFLSSRFMILDVSSPKKTPSMILDNEGSQALMNAENHFQMVTEAGQILSHSLDGFHLNEFERVKPKLETALENEEKGSCKLI